MAELAAAGAALASGAGSIFSYNKDAFVFDQTLRQNKIHQIQNMRLQQVGLYREDLRDLFGLTITKMDNYLVVNTLMLGFCIALFYDGVLPPENPPWLWWMWCLNLSGSTMFLLVSVWLSLHASITAQAFAAVASVDESFLYRLPVPGTDEIAAASATLKDYEASGVGSSILRIPGLHRLAPKNEEVDATMARKHEQLQKMERDDMKKEADRMVCMAMGTNQLLMTLAIFALGTTMIGDRQPWAAWAFVVVMATTALLHFKINLILSKGEAVLMTFLIYCAPLSAGVAATFDYAGEVTPGKAIALVSFILNGMWVCFVLVQAIESKGGLPAKFSTVGISSEIIGENQVHNFIQQELADLGIDTKNASEFLWGDVDRGDSDAETPSKKLEKECASAQRKLQKLFRRFGRNQEQLSRLQQGEIINLKEEFEKIRNGLHLSMVELGRAGQIPANKLAKGKWVKLSYFDDTSGQSVNYYLNTDTGDIRWQPPLLELKSMGSSSDSLGESPSPTPEEIATELHAFYEAVRKFQDATGTSEVKGGQKRHSSELYEHGHSDRISKSLLPEDIKRSPGLEPIEEVKPNVTFASTSADWSEGGGGGKDEVKGEDRGRKQFIKYSSRPWSIYKQASSIVVFTWAVGLIWGLLDVLNVPTGTGLILPGGTGAGQPRLLKTSAEIFASLAAFFVPVGLATKGGESGTLVATDGISIWPEGQCDVGWEGREGTDVVWWDGSILIAFGGRALWNCSSGTEVTFPMEIAKIGFVGASRAVAANGEGRVYMLERGSEGEWRKRVKIGDYQKDTPIAGIAHSEESDVSILLSNGTLHRWDLQYGSLRVTELDRSEGVERYTGIASLKGGEMVVAALMADHTAQLVVVSTQ
ncbi:pumilio domain member 4 [Perkinsus chesapeaki]|uniref:Pumilio domain member 4 n=1 Tax=Perkinsus chesapeaki TaxID=330153 RepID=A0A7J6MMR5_PERCH|nr:pumilio domain member 4 [Perkinsus chesapeaki]